MMGMSSTEWSVYVHDELGLTESAVEINAEVVHCVLDRYLVDLPLVEGAVDAIHKLAVSLPLAVSRRRTAP